MFCSKCLVLLCVLALSKSDDVSPDLLSVFLHTDLNETDPVDLMQANLSEIYIDITKPTAFICHGWINNANSPWIPSLIDALLVKGYNVLVADWSKYANSFYFLESAPDTDPVGQAFGTFIVNLHDSLNVSLDTFHCIGHSLGAHVCGFIGQQINTTTGQKISRISGLDPAGPYFNLASSSHRLSTGDAGFVDVIHSNAGVFGIIDSIGHIDFWPNGGQLQLAGCVSTFQNYTFFCSHVLAVRYFTESVNSNNFVATKCSSYLFYSLKWCKGNEEAIMGENVNPAQRGNFYLNTNIAPPFAQGTTSLT